MNTPGGDSVLDSNSVSFTLTAGGGGQGAHYPGVVGGAGKASTGLSGGTSIAIGGSGGGGGHLVQLHLDLVDLHLVLIQTQLDMLVVLDLHKVVMDLLF